LASAEKIIEKGLKAALELAATRPWADIPLAEIAARAKLALSDFHGVASREDLVEELDAWFDKAMSAEGVPDETSARERLFDVIMLRFEAMEPYRAGLAGILKFRETSLTHLVRLPAHRQASAAWALASAGLDDDGAAPASLKRIAIALVIGQAERAWRKETSGDFALTMAALDKGLRRAEDRLGQFRRLTGRRASSPKPEAEEAAS
jgi:AcrR family transcriptional regulator